MTDQPVEAFFCDVCDRWHGETPDEPAAAGQGLYDAEGGNMRAEAATGWEQAVERVGQAGGES